jgi:uncharacterized protein (TIGR00725 family)
MTDKIFISVIGESEATPKNYKLGEEVGREIAKAGAILVCGGLYGIMEAACKGAKSEGGTTIGILPGSKREEANPYIDFPIITGVGYARNKFVVKTGMVCIAVGGSYGTLSEIAFALGYNIPVIGLNTWEIHQYGQKKADDKIIYVKTPREAVKKALAIIKKQYQIEHQREYKT